MRGHRAFSSVAAVMAVVLTPVAAGQFHDVDPAAQKAFADSLKRYREMPAIDVETTVRIGLGQGEIAAEGDEVKARIFTVRNGRGLVEIHGFTCILGDEQVNVTHEASEDGYFTAPDDGSPYYALVNLFRDLPFPHLAIALGEQSVEDVCMQLHSKAPWLVPTAVTEIQENGRPMRRIRFTSDNATLDLFAEPTSGLFVHGKLEITGGMFVQPGTTMTYEYEFDHTLHDQAPDPSTFAFDPGERQRVMMLSTLKPEPEPAAAPEQANRALPAGPLVGRKAPPFILATMNGDAIDLEELRGQVVVLDFWASWCGPCVNDGIPTLHKISDWAREAMHPVKIVTINVFERPADGNDTPDQRLAKARESWQQHGFSLPVAMDFTDETAGAYSVTAIPTTVIVRADGTVHAQHVGAVAREKIQKDIEAAIRILEDEPN